MVKDAGTMLARQEPPFLLDADARWQGVRIRLGASPGTWPRWTPSQRCQRIEDGRRLSPERAHRLDQIQV